MANIMTLIAIASPSTATTFTFTDIPYSENLLLSIQQEEDPDEEPGETVIPN
ncbi:MAG: hypothetical protein O4965_27555 [Trichodesmium sp. St19_bin1]|nr:hypothetical protein [Trichodesmium sp. St19_bin1]